MDSSYFVRSILGCPFLSQNMQKSHEMKEKCANLGRNAFDLFCQPIWQYQWTRDRTARLLAKRTPASRINSPLDEMRMRAIAIRSMQFKMIVLSTGQSLNMNGNTGIYW